MYQRHSTISCQKKIEGHGSQLNLHEESSTGEKNFKIVVYGRSKDRGVSFGQNTFIESPMYSRMFYV